LTINNEQNVKISAPQQLFMKYFEAIIEINLS